MCLFGVCGNEKREINEAIIGHLAKQGCISQGGEAQDLATIDEEARAVLEAATFHQDEVPGDTIGILASLWAVFGQGAWLTHLGASFCIQRARLPRIASAAQLLADPIGSAY